MTEYELTFTAKYDIGDKFREENGSSYIITDIIASVDNEDWYYECNLILGKLVTIYVEEVTEERLDEMEKIND